MEGVRILVTYYSRTGSTEEMARAVAEGVREVKGAEAVLKRVEDVRVEELREYDGIIIGSPTYYGQMASEVKRLIDESVKLHGELEGKVGAAFSSCGARGGGCETTVLSIIKAMLIHGMIVQGDPEEHHYGVVSVGKPDDAVLRACGRLGRRVAELALRLKKGGRRL